MAFINSNFIFVLSTISLLYAIAVCLLQILQLSKKVITVEFSLSFTPVNSLFGVFCTTFIIALLCYYLILNRSVPFGVDSFFPIEQNKWSKFFFQAILAVNIFFYSGNFGVIGGIFLMFTSVLYLQHDFTLPRHKVKEDKTMELENLER